MALRRRTLLPALIGLGAAAGPARALSPPIYLVPFEQVRDAFAAGGTLVGHMDDRLFVERYEPGGRLRGTYAGRAYEGRWRLERERLCTEVAPHPPLCVTVQGLDAAPMGDGKGLWLFREDGRAAMLATYRTRAPWQSRSAPMSARVTVRTLGRDDFGVEGAVAGLPPVFAVWTGREMALRPGEAVIIHGTTDGVTFAAERVTRPDGAPIR